MARPSHVTWAVALEGIHIRSSPRTVDQVNPDRRSRSLWAALGVLVAVATDLGSSAWAVDRLGTRPVAGTLGGLVQLRVVANTGVSFGLGAGHEAVVALAEVGALVVLIVLALRTPSRVTAFFVGGVAGGGLGNLIDRTIGPHGNHHGAVIDWIHIAPYPAVFNLADLWIRVGLVAAGLALLARNRRSPDAEPAGPRQGPPAMARTTLEFDPGHRSDGRASPTDRRS